MLPAIGFHDKPLRHTSEIRDKRPHRMLPSKLCRSKLPPAQQSP
jgi:hypothetical protein